MRPVFFSLAWALSVTVPEPNHRVAVRLTQGHSAPSGLTEEGLGKQGSGGTGRSVQAGGKVWAGRREQGEPEGLGPPSAFPLKGGACKEGRRGVQGQWWAWPAGLSVPRTPCGLCRRSGCTAAAGPPDHSPFDTAPRRQEKPRGTGSPIAKVPATPTSARPAEPWAGRGPPLGLGLRLWPAERGPRLCPGALVHRGAPCQAVLPLTRVGTAHGMGARGRRRAPQGSLKSKRPQVWTQGLLALGLLSPPKGNLAERAGLSEGG